MRGGGQGGGDSEGSFDSRTLSYHVLPDVGA